MIQARIKQQPDDFHVEELPAYGPSGDGEHLFLWIEKRDVSPGWLLNRLSRYFGVKKRDIGVAGNKDRRAVTRQWVSLPAEAAGGKPPGELTGSLDDGIRVLEAGLHGNKLRTGHLKGNRFRILLREMTMPAGPAAVQIDERLQQFVQSGVPNYFGEQRFGRDRQTIELGLDLLRGEKQAKKKVSGNRYLRRMAVSALQAELFNRVLASRLEQGWFDRVQQGDVMKRTDSGGEFRVDSAREVESVQQRLNDGQVAITGPLFGPRMTRPSGPAWQLESGVLEREAIELDDFSIFGKLARGARRPLTVWLNGGAVEAGRDERGEYVALSFELPPGSYATVVLDELVDKAV